MKKFLGLNPKRNNEQAQEEYSADPAFPISEEIMMPMEAPAEEEHAQVERVSFMDRHSDTQFAAKNKFAWNKLSRICIYILFGIMPLFFLPFSGFPTDDAKVFLIALSLFVAAAAYVAQVLATGRVELVRTKLWMLFLIFLGLAGISTLFSLSPAVSIWGNSHQPDTLFVFIYGFIALFATSAVFRSAGQIKKAHLFLGISAIIVALSSLFQFFGKYPLIFDFTRSTSFNVFGSLESLSVFLGLGLVVIIAMLSIVPVGKVMRIAMVAGACCIVAALLLLNSSYVWLGLMLGFALAASWQIMKGFPASQGESALARNDMRMHSHFGLFIALMLVSAVIFFVGVPTAQIVSLPPTVSPSFMTTLNIAKDTFHEGALRTLIGSGPGTFLYQYLIHRPDAINSTSFFGLRFAQGFSFMSTLLVSLGLLGFLAMLVTMGYFTVLAFRKISARGGTIAQRGETLVSFVGFIFLFFSWFFFALNIPLIVLTFLFAGLVLADLRNEGALKEVHISFNQSPQAVFTFSFVAVVLLAVITVSAYWHVQKYAAAFASTMSVQEYNNSKGAKLDDAMAKMGFAISMDGTNELDLRTLSQLFALKANGILQNSSSANADTLQQNFQQQFQNAIQAARLATSVNDRDPLNWQAVGDVYATFMNVVGGADTFALDSYQEMVNRDPKDPAAYLTLAQAYMNASDAATSRAKNLSQGSGASAQQSQVKQLQSQASDYLNKAQGTLKQAITLKPDYAAALFLSAQIYDQQGDRKQAIATTKQAQAINPQDVGIAYQLGVLYYLDGQFDAAGQVFAQAVALDPSYSNARYFLGLVYAKQGQTQNAIQQFQEIEKLNPDNNEIKQIIANLQAGKDPLDGLTPPQQTTQTPVPQTGGLPAPTQLKK